MTHRGSTLKRRREDGTDPIRSRLLAGAYVIRIHARGSRWGATRGFLVRPSAGGKSITFHVETGDLIVMGARCQRDSVHIHGPLTLPRSRGTKELAGLGKRVKATLVAARLF